MYVRSTHSIPLNVICYMGLMLARVNSHAPRILVCSGTSTSLLFYSIEVDSNCNLLCAMKILTV